MASQDQIIQHKALNFRTLSNHHSDQVAKFVARNSTSFQHSDQQQKLRKCSIANLMIIPSLKSQWSFGLYENSCLVGAYLQLDVLDYLNIAKLVGNQLLTEMFQLELFDQYWRKNIMNAKRGDYLLNKNNAIFRKELALIHQGFYLCKLGGWKNIIFITQNPIPFLKINAQVIAQSNENSINSLKPKQIPCMSVSPISTISSHNINQIQEFKECSIINQNQILDTSQFFRQNKNLKSSKTKYLMKLQMKNLNLTANPFHKIYSRL